MVWYSVTFVIVETRTGLRTCTHDFSLFPSFHIMVFVYFVPFPILQLDTPCCSALECLVHLSRWLLVLYFNCIVWFLMDWCTKKERKNIIEMSSHMKTNLDSFKIRASCWTARLPWYTFLPFASAERQCRIMAIPCWQRDLPSGFATEYIYTSKKTLFCRI